MRKQLYYYRFACKALIFGKNLRITERSPSFRVNICLGVFAAIESADIGDCRYYGEIGFSYYGKTR